MRRGPKAACARFGEDQMKFVTRENFLMFLMKSNMAAESMTMTSQVDLHYHQTPLVHFNSKHIESYRPKCMFC